MKNKRVKKVLIGVIVLTIVVIWGHSMMPGDVSGEESGFVYRVLGPVLRLFLPDAWVSEHLVRKIAHFSEYAVLGTELTIDGMWYGEYHIRHILRVFYSGLTAAFLDETIQIFSGRGPAIVDVWIDLAGFSTAMVIVGLIGHRWRKKRREAIPTLEVYPEEDETEDEDEYSEISGSEWFTKMQEHITPGIRLRIRRENKGWTQAELSKRCGIAVPNISLMEANRRGIGVKSARKLAGALGCDVSEFVS